MKPTTKFCRAITKLAKAAGLPVIAVTESMTGVDSRTRKGWVTFHLKLAEGATLAKTFIEDLERINRADPGFVGQHNLTELTFDVSMAVRTISIGSRRYGVTAEGSLMVMS